MTKEEDILYTEKIDNLTDSIKRIDTIIGYYNYAIDNNVVSQTEAYPATNYEVNNVNNDYPDSIIGNNDLVYDSNISVSFSFFIKFFTLCIPKLIIFSSYLYIYKNLQFLQP